MQNLVITNKGQELMAKMIAGTSTATFTKIATSDFDYSGENLEELIQMYSIRQEALVSGVTRTNLTLIEVLAAVENSTLTEGYHIRGLGLYAMDSDGNEILYGVSIETQNPDFMPAFAGQTVSGVSYRLNTIVDNSAQVLLKINPAAVPTMAQVNAIQVEINTHVSQSVYSESGVHGLRIFGDILQSWNPESESWVDVESEEVLEAVTAIASKIGNPSDSGSDTIFGKLNSGETRYIFSDTPQISFMDISILEQQPSAIRWDNPVIVTTFVPEKSGSVHIHWIMTVQGSNSGWTSYLRATSHVSQAVWDAPDFSYANNVNGISNATGTEPTLLFQAATTGFAKTTGTVDTVLQVTKGVPILFYMQFHTQMSYINVDEFTISYDEIEG